MSTLKKMILAFALVFSVNHSFGNNCLDSAYLRMQQSKLSEISVEEFSIYKRLDSLCSSENLAGNKIDSSIKNDTIEKASSELTKKQKPRINPKDAFYNRYQDEPYSSESDVTDKRKSSIGRGWFWASLGIGGLYFVGSSVVMSTISDECSPIFITDLFKSEEQCKNDADQARQVAGIGMVLGGIMSAIGLYGLAATSTGPIR